MIYYTDQFFYRVKMERSFEVVLLIGCVLRVPPNLGMFYLFCSGIIIGVTPLLMWCNFSHGPVYFHSEKSIFDRQDLNKDSIDLLSVSFSI